MDIIEPTADFDPIATLFEGDFTLEQWSNRINAAGRLTFRMHAFHPKATATNLRIWNRVRLNRKKRDGTGEYEAVWFGYLEVYKQIDSELEIVCSGMLDLFRKRYTAADEQFDGAGSTEAYGLLSDSDSDSDSGITAGVTTVASTRDLTIDAQDILRAWEQLAQSHGAEFEITPAGVFNFTSSLGSDKSSTVELMFRHDGEPGTDVLSLEFGEDGRDMANRIIGASSGGGGLTATDNDATSQTTYGVLIERKTFNEANDQTTLDALNEAYLAQRANPITDFRIQPRMAQITYNQITGARSVQGLQYEDIVVGDLVTVTVQTQSRNFTQTKRIAEIIVAVDEEGQESVLLTLAESGVFITAAFLDATQVQELRRKLQEVEAQL